jgi:hydroxyacylglutathione hydrolase
MLFRMLYDHKLAQAAYLIGCQRTGEAIVIDPERDVDRYLEEAKRNGLRIAAIAETHIHADFLSGARELAERTGARLYLSAEGGPDWQYRWLDKKSGRPAQAGGGSYNYQLLKDGGAFKVGNIQFNVIHTPGHTPEHICFLVTDLGGGASEPMGIASGDFVFVGDVGRPDLLETAAGVAGTKETSAQLLYRSIQRFKKLPDYLQVWPAHGAGSACGKALGAVPQSTVGYEKRFNPAICEAGSETQFVQSILYGQTEPPYYFARMKKENRDGPAILGKLPDPKPLSVADLKNALKKDAFWLDTRRWPHYRAGHLPGALYAPLNTAFPTIAGSYVEPGRPIYLVVEEDCVREAVTDLIRIGLDDIVGYVTPHVQQEYLQAGGKLAASASKNITDLRDEHLDGSEVLLDVRRADEFEAGHLNGALNVPHTRLLPNLANLPKDKRHYVYCQSGNRSAYACGLLQRHGFEAVQLEGGFSEWQKAGGEIVQ